MTLLHRLAPVSLFALALGACSEDSSTCPAGQGFCAATNTCVLTPADCVAPVGTGGAGTGGAGTGGAPSGGSGGLTDCSGAQVDLLTNAANCGACGVACGAGQACVAGACGCAPGLVPCGGACVDTTSSSANCGACGVACTGAAVCSAGTCSTAGCSAGLTLCGSDCVNTAINLSHCGACSSPCPSGTQCIGGACSCPEPQTLCGSACVNTASDSVNCGACGVQCTAGQTCNNGCQGGGTTTCDPTVNPTTQICDRYGKVGVNCSEYLVQNNVWNEAAANQTLCTSVTGTSFNIASSGLSVGGGAPAAYPSIVKGCHHSSCSLASLSNMPKLVSSINTATSSWSFATAAGTWNISYDIWILPGTAATYNTFAGGTELMIWLNHQGGIQPFGGQVGTASIDGANWNVWTGNVSDSGGSWKYIAYVRQATTTSVTNLNLKAFIQDAVSRGQAANNNYLKAIEAGFEIWQGGQGMRTTSFSATVN